MVRYIFFVVLLIILLPYLNFAGVELPPTADTFVGETYPNGVYGSSNNVHWGWIAGNDSWGLIKFGGLEDYSGVSLSDAILYIYIYDYPGYDDYYNRLYRITGSWEENTATWNNKPPYDEDNWTDFLIWHGGGWYFLDITEETQDWLDGIHPNHGLYFRRTAAPYEYWRFHSKEYSDPDLHPKLIIYFSTAIKTVSLGKIKATFK